MSLKNTVNAPRRKWNVARAFSAIKHNHNLNARCSAVLPRKFLSSFGEYLPDIRCVEAVRKRYRHDLRTTPEADERKIT